MQARSTTSESFLAALPWDSPLSSKRNGIKQGRGKQNNLWASAPNLDFNSDWREDDGEFETSDEPDFSKSFHNLSFDVNFDDIDDGEDGKESNPFRQDSPTRVKVKSRRDNEIKDLFTKWKTDQKKPMVEDWQSDAPTKDGAAFSPVITKVNKLSSKSKVASPSKNYFPVDAINDGSPPTKLSSPKRKKKIAVKLKASDLNLSEEKQKEIEQMFWKLKQNPQAKGSDKRWSDVQKQQSIQRPKPATRQLSLDREEIDFDRPRPLSPEKMKPLMPSRSDTLSGSSSRNLERRSSRDERKSSRDSERSRSRNPDRLVRSKSKSRSPSSQRSKSREPRSSSRSDATERSPRARSSSRGPSSESKSMRLRRQTSVDSAESCSSGRSRSRPRRTASRSRRLRSTSQSRLRSASQD